MQQLNELIEDFKNKSVNERLHVWNNVYKFNEDEATFVDKIYNFCRLELFRKMNDAATGTGHIFIVDVSEDLLIRRHINDTEQLIPLKVVYDSLSNENLMKTVHNKDNSVTITVKINLFDNLFKSKFFRELKHYYQYFFSRLIVRK